MNLNQGVKKYSYYVSFTTTMFLGAKELLKSMPTFYNKIYFSTKYAGALWSGDKEETFESITILTENENINALRQIIKNNFLYIGDWDSTKFTDKADYGFSFIGGNIKYILMPFMEVEDGYIVRSYDADSANCYETHYACDKKYFLDTSMKNNGEMVRICDFNLEYMTDANTTVTKAEKKAGPQMVTYQGNSGHALINMLAIMLISLLSIATVYASYHIISTSVLG